MIIILYINDTIDFYQLSKYGFTEDPVNCEHPEDHYYYLNNWFWQHGDFRITVNTLDRKLDILCLAKNRELYNIYDFDVLYDLFKDGLVEKR